MWKRFHFLGISGLAICAVACGSPRPSDISSDGGIDGTVIPPIVGSNTVTRADLATGIAPLVVPAGGIYLLNTDQGSMFDAKNASLPIRVVGPGVKDGVFYRSDDQNRAFFAVQSLMIGEGAILRGVGTRALVLVADGPIEIHGLLDVSAGHCSITTDGIDCAGPGGGRGGSTATAPAGCSPGHPGAAVTAMVGGSGGGGFGSPGGGGGAGGSSVPGGAGGSGVGCPGSTLDPLQGGSGGSTGGGLGGGGGGGAVQVTSYTSIALVSSTIVNSSGVWAGGGGGRGGAPGGSGPIAGSGGGAGGAILLEAPTVDVRPGVVLAANGGGGGAGALTVDGQPGQFGSAPAVGGAGSSGAAGGAGAARNANALDGAPGVTTQQSTPAGGGGGGGIGRIRINSIAPKLSDQAVLSPTPSINVLPAS